jgi:hypothetical protein
VAAQGDRARSTRAPAIPRPKDRLTTRRRRAPRRLLNKPRDPSQKPVPQSRPFERQPLLENRESPS